MSRISDLFRGRIRATDDPGGVASVEHKKPSVTLLAPEPQSAGAPKTETMASRRAQTIRYEQKANDGRYCSNASVATGKEDHNPKPLKWAVIPLGPISEANFFASATDKEAKELSAALFREMQLPGWDAPKPVVLLPVHWEEAVTLKKRFPSLHFIEDGKVYRGASPRSLFIGADPSEVPKLVPGIEKYSLKMHLSLETYERLGGLGGNRDINKNDALMASVLDHVLTGLLPKMSPYLQYQSEGKTIAVKLEGKGRTQEVGMIFRGLNECDAVPGFAMYSKTQETLAHAPKAQKTLKGRAEPNILGADAIAALMKKNPGMSKLDAFDQLFAEPIYDVIFSMAKEGVTMELHPQNFLFRFDEKTARTKNIVVRDLHGIGYSAKLRKEKGLDEPMSVEKLKDAFPGISQADLDGYFMREGKIRDRYEAPGMFKNTLDFFSAMFFYHMLDSLFESGTFTKKEVNQAVERIKDRMEQKAVQHGFDLRVLAKAPEDKKNEAFWVAEKQGIRGRVLFRRPEPKLTVQK